MSQKLTSAVLAAGLAAAAFTHAQDLCPCPKAPPEPAWKASVGGGLSLTGGNTNANSYNLSFSVTHDPRLRNIFKAEGLYLRTDQDGQATADKSSASLRDEYKFGRAYLFGQLAYLRDPLKDLDYLLSPALGAGYRLLERKSLLLTADASLGAAVERLSGREATSDLAAPRLAGLTFREALREGIRSVEDERLRGRLLPLRGESDRCRGEAARIEARLRRRLQEQAGLSQPEEERHGAHRGARLQDVA
jgi:hypothetical protein